jgi:hypothetical protein
VGQRSRTFKPSRLSHPGPTEPLVLRQVTESVAAQVGGVRRLGDPCPGEEWETLTTVVSASSSFPSCPSSARNVCRSSNYFSLLTRPFCVQPFPPARNDMRGAVQCTQSGFTTRVAIEGPRGVGRNAPHQVRSDRSSSATCAGSSEQQGHGPPFWFPFAVGAMRVAAHPAPPGMTGPPGWVQRTLSPPSPRTPRGNHPE